MIGSRERDFRDGNGDRYRRPLGLGQYGQEPGPGPGPGPGPSRGNFGGGGGRPPILSQDMPNMGGSGGSDRNGRRGRRDNTPAGVSLLVRNIHADITSADLEGAFRRIGEIKDVYIPRDYHSQKPKGFAFIEYATREQARAAKDEMNHFLMKGRELEVVFAQEKRKSPGEMIHRSEGDTDGGEVGVGGSNSRAGSFERSSSFERHRRREEDRRRGAPGPMDRVDRSFY